MFAKQLMQIQSMTPAKAVAIVELYPTPQALMQAYADTGTDAEAIALLANVRAAAGPRGGTGRALGPSLSSIVAHLYGDLTLI